MIAVASLAAACDGSSPSGIPLSELTPGTWGGPDAGVVVSAAVTHVHIGCTYGDFPALIELDDRQRFSVPGEYQLRGFPVVRDPPVPARFAGVVSGDRLTLTVAVNDTITNELVVLGPVTVTYGREPDMVTCPICAM